MWSPGGFPMPGMEPPAGRSQVLLWIGGSMAAVTAAFWALLLVHVQGTHSQSVTQKRFEQYVSEQAEWRLVQRAALHRLENKLEKTNDIVSRIAKEYFKP